MKLADLGPAAVAQRLGSAGVGVRVGPVVFRIRAPSVDLEHTLTTLYAHHDVVDDDHFADFHVELKRPAGLRRWVRPQVTFAMDGSEPFAPLPLAHAMPLMEWGLNWCVSNHYHRYLIVHAASIERNNRVLILPAPPGSGKSTLCAGLVSRGWRLFSDELTVIDPRTGRIVALPRPLSLKNESIGVMRRFANEARFGPVVRDTVKGTVAHMVPPRESVERAEETALPGWLVMPRFKAGSPTDLRLLARGAALLQLADNAFNYSLHGRQGFETLCDLVSRVECFEFEYSSLAEATALFEQIASGTPQ